MKQILPHNSAFCYTCLKKSETANTLYSDAVLLSDSKHNTPFTIQNNNNNITYCIY